MARSVEIGALRVALGMDTAEFVAGAAVAQRKLNQLSGLFKSFGVGVLAALGVSQIGQAFSAITERLDGLGKAAQKIGIPVDQLSKLEYAAKLADVPIEGLQAAVGKLSKGLAEFQATGKGDAGAALRAIGVSATTSNGQLRPTIEIIQDIAARFAMYEDSANKTALAMALFGKAGADMIPLLNGGRQGLADASAEAERFGIVVSGESAAAAELLNDNMVRLQTAGQGLATIIATPVISALTGLTEELIRTFGGVGDLEAALDGPLRKSLAGIAAFALETAQAFRAVFTILSVGIDNFNNGQGFEVAMERWRKAFADVRIDADATRTKIDDLYRAAQPDPTGSLRAIDRLVPPVPAVPPPRAAAPNFNSVQEADTARERSALEREKRERLRLSDIDRAAAQREADALRLRNEKQAEARAIFDSTRTSLERYNIEVTRLTTLNQQGYLATDDLNRALFSARFEYLSGEAALNSFGEEAEDTFSQMKQFADTLKSSFQSAFDAALEGSFSLQDSLRGLLSQVTSQAFSRALDLLFRPSQANPIYGDDGGGLLTRILGGLLPGFARGGTIFPGGSGGIDSQIVAFRKSPNERVDITKPGQKLISGGGTNVTIIDQRKNAPAVERQQQQDGSLKIFIRDQVNSLVGSGQSDLAFAGRFGVPPSRRRN